MVVAVPFVLPVLLPLVVGFVILRKRYIMTSREVSLQPAHWHLCRQYNLCLQHLCVNSAVEKHCNPSGEGINDWRTQL